MSDEPSFRCPVCRASQDLRDVCRRCQADLSLVVRAHRRLAWLRQSLAEAGDDVARVQRIEAELRWLAPNR
jgi:hypothetical protein